MTKKKKQVDCTQGNKPCNRCNNLLPLDAFWKSKTESCGRGGICKACQNKKRVYETSDEQAVRIYRVTLGYARSRRTASCEICGLHASNCPRGTLHIDHDHDTNKVRGLLCHWCNLALGAMRDEPQRLRDAAKYLEERQNNE